jgi:hypothetical protein
MSISEFQKLDLQQQATVLQDRICYKTLDDESSVHLYEVDDFYAIAYIMKVDSNEEKVINIEAYEELNKSLHFDEKALEFRVFRSSHYFLVELLVMVLERIGNYTDKISFSYQDGDILIEIDEYRIASCYEAYGELGKNMCNLLYTAGAYYRTLKPQEPRKGNGPELLLFNPRKKLELTIQYLAECLGIHPNVFLLHPSEQ